MMFKGSRASFCVLSLAVAFVLLLPFTGAAQTDNPLTGNTQVVPAGKSIWKRVHTPNIGGANLLFSLSALSEQNIWAVGDFVSLNFDGQQWNAIPLAFPGGESSMNGVAAISPTDVRAVGSTLINNHLISVIEHFDGSAWTIVPSPQFASGSILNKLQAFSSSDIFAVGETNSDIQRPRPLVEHFDGTKWSVMHTPTLKAGQIASLSVIAGLSHSDFWIAGSSEGRPGVPVVMHFDGKKFSQVPFPGTGVSIGGITELANNDAWIVGAENGFPMTAHWDGKAWKKVPAPRAGTSSGLTGVSAISSTDLWASGDVTDQRGFSNLVEHWDGKKWTISRIPSPVGGFDELAAVLAFPSGSVFVAGTGLHCEANGCGGFDSVIFHTTKGK
jgi:hypothetical protein